MRLLALVALGLVLSEGAAARALQIESAADPMVQWGALRPFDVRRTIVPAPATAPAMAPALAQLALLLPPEMPSSEVESLARLGPATPLGSPPPVELRTMIASPAALAPGAPTIAPVVARLALIALREMPWSEGEPPHPVEPTKPLIPPPPPEMRSTMPTPAPESVPEMVPALAQLIPMIPSIELSVGEIPVPRHWTPDERILLDVRRQLMSSAHLDATDVDRKSLWTFYAGRRGGPVWVDELGWGPAALAVIDEMRHADDWGLDASAFQIPELVHEFDGPPTLDAKSRAAGELALSLAVLKFARHARGGRIETPDTQLSSYLDRKPQVRRPWRVMTEIADAVAPDAYLRGLNPQHPQFEALRQRYLAMRDGFETETRIEVPERGQKFAPGSSHPDIAVIRERLGLTLGYGDPEVYDADLVEAVKKFQRKKDLSDSGIIDRRTRRAFNATVDVSEKSLLANMEQWRWMPENLGEAYVWVNIPEFMMRVVKDGKVVHEERVVTGRVSTQTPIFSADMKTIFFHPRWYVPESIKVNEVLPSMAGGGSYFRNMGFKVLRNGREINPRSVKWYKTDIRHYDIYQPPGPGNALGILKFTFPNKHAVYLHDTPNKGLFNSTERTFSHGCMRLRNPQRLAEVLLAIDKGWDAQQVALRLEQEPTDTENGVPLDKHIPVHVTYFTVWADEDGELDTREDVYGHEKRITLGLQGKWASINKGEDHLAATEPDDAPKPSYRSRKRSSPRRVARGSRGGGSSGGGWSARATRVSQGNSAHDIFRRGFGY